MTTPAWLLCPTCGHAAMFADQFCLQCASERRFASRYLVEAIQASGGMGVVYRAYDEELDDRVAIKVVAAEGYDGRESQFLTRYGTHFSFVPRLHAELQGPLTETGGSESNYVYLVMDYFDAPSLAQMPLYHGRADRVEHFLRVMLGYLHQLHTHQEGSYPAPIYHLDLKPANILAHGEGYILLDFGSALGWGPAARTQPKTPSYAAPEQLTLVAGERLDGRADLFSLALTACVLYVAPAEAEVGGWLEGLRARLAQHAGRSLGGMVEGLPPHLDATLAGMLAWKREHRLQSARGALACLDEARGDSLARGEPRGVTADHSSRRYADPTAQPEPLVKQLGNGRATHVAWSPDTRTLAVASRLGLYLYDAQSLEPRGARLAGGLPLRDLQYTGRGDGLSLLVGQTRRGLALTKHAMLDTEDERMLPGEPTDPIALPAHGRWVAVGQADEVYLWEVATHRWLDDPNAPAARLPGPGGRVTRVAVSHDGSTLAVASDEGVKVYQVGADWKELTPRLALAVKEATSLALSDDGGVLAIARNGWIELWQLRPRDRLGALPVGVQPVTHLAFASDHGRLAVVARGAVLVWRTSGESARRLTYHIPAAQAVALSPEGRYLASLGGGLLQVWSLVDNRLLWASEGHSYPTAALAFSPDGLTLAASTPAGVRLWSVAEQAVVGDLPAPVPRQGGLAFSARGQWLVVASDESVTRWRWQGEQALQIGREALDEAGSVALAQDGETVAVLREGTVRVHRFSLPGQDWTLDAPDDAHSLALAPDGRQLVILGDSGTEWRREGEPLRRLTFAAQGACFAPGGSAVALLQADQVHLWSVGASDPAPVGVGAGSYLNAVALSAGDQPRLVVADEDGALRVQTITL